MAADGFFPEWFASSYFPPVWFAPADDEHLTEEERRPLALVPFDHEVSRKRTPPDSEESLARLFRRERLPAADEVKAERVKLGILPPDQLKIAKERDVVSRKLQQTLEQAQSDKAAIDQALLWELHTYEALLAAEYQKLLEQGIKQEKARIEEEDVAFVLAVLTAS